MYVVQTLNLKNDANARKENRDMEFLLMTINFQLTIIIFSIYKLSQELSQDKDKD